MYQCNHNTDFTNCDDSLLINSSYKHIKMLKVRITYKMSLSLRNNTLILIILFFSLLSHFFVESIYEIFITIMYQ